MLRITLSVCIMPFYESTLNITSYSWIWNSSNPTGQEINSRSPLHYPWFGYLISRPTPLDSAQTPVRPWLRSQPAVLGVPLPRLFYQLTCARCDRRGYFRSISFFEIRFIWNVHPVPLCTAIITSFKPAKIVSFNMCWRSLGEKAVIYPSKDLKQLLMTLTTVNYWFIYVNRIRLFFTQHLQR